MSVRRPFQGIPKRVQAGWLSVFLLPTPLEIVEHAALSGSHNELLIAQPTTPSVPLPQSDQFPIDPPNALPEPELPWPEQMFEPLPSADELLRPSAEIEPEIEELPSKVPGTITVLRFEILGSTVFNPSDLAAATEPFTGRPITFAELLAARAAVTQLYIDQGYVTSAAYIPADQVIDTGVVKIQVIEGQLTAVNVQGLTRLNPSYVSSRIAVASPHQPIKTVGKCKPFVYSNRYL